MPRIHATNGDAYDYCRECWQHHGFSDEATAYDAHQTGDGPDARGDCFGHDCPHPLYEDDEYRCAACGVDLTDDD